MRRLLIRPGAIGDFILSLPAMEALRADYTEVWCAEQNIPLARFADSARSIVSAGLDRLGFLPADDVLERLRPFNSIVSWYGTKRPEFHELMKASGIPVQFLTALPDGALPDGLVPAADFYNRQARSLGGTPNTRFPAVPCPATPRIYAVVHPFASSPAKRAPMELFRKTADRLAGHMPVHWICGPEENLPGATRFGNLYDLACWLSGARVYVGNDSGITHLAAAVGTPTLALFQSTDPRVWAPPASYWTRLEMPRSS
jgi:heptosyltransferase-3